MDFNSLDAIEFLQDGKKHLRVYYQTTKDNAIRESSFDDANGWFVRGHGIVAGHAKIKSPITVTRWNTDDTTLIRLYFLDPDNKIHECRGRHKSDVTIWEEQTTVVQIIDEPNEPQVAAGSQLAVARPSSDDNSLRVFYQEKLATTPNAKSLIREIKYIKMRGGEYQWQLQMTKISGSLTNTRLSAVSAKPSGQVRLYHQGEQGQLLESFWNSRNWVAPTELHQKYNLVLGAPIHAVSWYDGEPRDDSTLSIRIYTILKAIPHSISELAFNENWYGETTEVAHSHYSTTQPPVYSALAIARRIDVPPQHPITLFHHLRDNVIDIQAIAANVGTVYSEQAGKVVHPVGIPTSR